MLDEDSDSDNREYEEDDEEGSPPPPPPSKDYEIPDGQQAEPAAEAEAPILKPPAKLSKKERKMAKAAVSELREQIGLLQVWLHSDLPVCGVSKAVGHPKRSLLATRTKTLGALSLHRIAPPKHSTLPRLKCKPSVARVSA